MFSATYFTYDGTHSSVFGLQMLDFNDESVTETTAFSPVLNLNKTKASKRFFFGGVSYDQAPQHTFSVISETKIDDAKRREVLSWLVGRNSFKKLVIHQTDLENYWYNCIFTNVDIIYIQGVCHGFRLTATFDSPYQRGEDVSMTFDDTNTGRSFTFNSRSDVVDGYVYPRITFSNISGNKLSITNLSDNRRFFEITGIKLGDHITIDNELRTIKSTSGKEYLSSFNKKWFRLCRGENNLVITCSGSGTITCPTYVMMGF